jgi:DNA modification methylase
MRIDMLKLSDIKPYANNPRHNAAAVNAVAASIQAYGFRQPIVVDEDRTIIAGHTRYWAAIKLGLDTVPVHVALGLTPAQVQAYRLADNRTGEIATWDEERLVQELADLQRQDFQLELTGFSSEELSRLLDASPAAGLVDVDDVPEPPEEPLTRAGDLWLLGEHRLLCGDAAKADEVDRLLAGQAVHLVNADPPYNVNVEPRSKNAIAAGLSSFGDPRRQTKQRTARNSGGRPATQKMRPKDRPLLNDFVSAAHFEQLLHAWLGNLARVLLPGHSFYLWGGYSNCANYPPGLKTKGLYFSQSIIWVKEHPVLTRKDFMGNHEWCFYGWREGAAHRFFGPKNAVDVWPVKKTNPQQMVHLTEKPVELAVRALQYSSRPQENVLDLFGGSGSTLMAAAQTGRRAFLMEIDPPYCDVIVQRWQNLTGRKAEHQPSHLAA